MVVEMVFWEQKRCLCMALVRQESLARNVNAELSDATPLVLNLQVSARQRTRLYGTEKFTHGLVVVMFEVTETIGPPMMLPATNV